MTPRPRALRATALVLLLSASPVVVPAAAQEGPPGSRLELSDGDTAPSGTCNEFTARVISGVEGEGDPLQGVTIDVEQVLAGPSVEPDEQRELAFCNPTDPSGPNPTGQGGTSFGDVSGNNPAQTAGQPGRNTTVRGEIGPTDANGRVTFGITMTPGTQGTVSVRAWVDVTDDDSWSEGDEPSDTATKTWVQGEEQPVTGLDASPEQAVNQTNTSHQVSVTVTNNAGPVQGVVPNSVILQDATGRPAGDIANEGAGASPNYVQGQADPYTCSASTAAGVSTCTFQDPPGSGPGTDTIVLYVNHPNGGTSGPDQGEAGDAVQKSWQPPPPPPTSTPPPTATPTPGPTGPQARNIRLCHGDDVTPCDTTDPMYGMDEEHSVAALVTDRQGLPLANIPVELRETGPAVVRPANGNTAVAITGGDGVAHFDVYSLIEGTSTLVAEISPPGTPGSVRGPGAADDECEQPAGPGGTPSAGNCTATLTATWNHIDNFPCDDGLDNDDDGFVDEDDPGCDDGTEEPVNHETPRHPRRINMRFRDWVGPGDEGLAIFGRVRLADEDDRFRACTAGRPVELQRRVDGRWVTRKSLTTNQTGRYAGVLFDQAVEHRAVAPRVEVLDNQGDLHVCLRAVIVKTHHHRRK